MGALVRSANGGTAVGEDRRMRFAALLLSLLALACSSERRETPSSPPARTDPAPAPEPSAPPPEPLPEPREVRIQTADGVTLVGDLRAADPRRPLVVLVHQLGSTRAEWEPLVRRLGPQFDTFAFDLRGHGESTRRGDEEVAYARFEASDWARLPEDVRAVLRHLREEENLEPPRIALVGSSIGSSAAIVAAANEPSVSAVVAISPGRAYRGIDAITPVTSLGERPLLAVASRGEPPSAEAASDMARIAPRGEVLLVDGDRHGVAVFEAAPESLDRVERFLREALAVR